MIANAAWLCQFVLAALGFLFFYRRRVHALWIWLGFRAAADVVCAILYNSYNLYVWADYVQRQAQYALIALVSVYTVSQVLREHPRTRRAYLWLLGAMAICSVLLFHAGLPSASSVLKFEIWAEITLSGFVALAMGYVSDKPCSARSHHLFNGERALAVRGKWRLHGIQGGAPKPWGLIACGLVTLGSSDLLVTALRLWGWRAEGIYPVGEILALGILAAAGWRNYRLEEIRLELPPKIQPSSVGSPEILEMFGRMVN